MEKTDVAILCPIAETVPPLTFQSIASIVGYSTAHGININHIGVTERTWVETARNILAKEFLKTKNEWVLWLDVDMIFPKETLTQLLKTAKEKKAKMVTGVYYQRGGKHFPVLWIRSPELKSGRKACHENKNEYDRNKYIGMYALPGQEAVKPFKADTAGFGCSLIHREVFETMDYPYFLFLPQQCSEDFYFFVNARKKGYQLWADPKLEIKHIGENKLIGREDCYDSLEKEHAIVEPVKDGK